MAGFVHILPKIGLKQPSITRYVHLKHVRTNMHSKNAGLFQPKFGSNMDQTKCWVKNVIEKRTVESES